MKNILHVIGHLGGGGDTTVVLDIMNAIDQNEIHFDFVTHKGAREEIVQSVRSKGSNVYILEGDVRELGIIKYYRRIKEEINKSNIKYDAIHVHTGMQSGVALLAARSCGIKKRICHSHVSSIQREASLIKKILAIPVLRSLYMINSNVKVACSRMAGDYMFGKNTPYELIYNGIDTSLFDDVPWLNVKEFRKKLGFSEDDIVVGQVARFSKMKNQNFTLDVASSFNEKNNSPKFVFVGTGDEYENCIERAKNLDNVLFLGQRNDIPLLMKCFDCVILPSLKGEGFPMTILEAQAAGCRCIVSNNVTAEVDLGFGLVKNLALNDKDGWIKEIQSLYIKDHKRDKQEYAHLMDMKGFGKKDFYSKWNKLY